MQDQFIEKKGAEYSHFNNGKYGDRALSVLVNDHAIIMNDATEVMSKYKANSLLNTCLGR